MGTVNETLEVIGLKKVFNYLDNNPEVNVPKVLNWVRKFDQDDYLNNSILS